MKIQIDLDLKIPRWVRNAALVLAPAAFLVTAAVVRADVPNTFKDGDTLSAQKLNDDFAALDARLLALETSPAVPAGTIIAFGGETAPAGWIPCDGTQLDGSSPKYAALYAAIGTAYGGNTTSQMFNLPDLRGRFLRGWDHGAGVDPEAAGRTSPNAGGAVGDHVGTAQAHAFANHDHGVADPGHHHDQWSAYSGQALAAGSFLYAGTPDGAAHGVTSNNATGIAIQAAGGAETRPTNLAVNYIIKL